MKEERLIILNLLNEGKITAEEAAKLLETLNTATEAEGNFRHKHHKHYDSYTFAWDDWNMDEKLSKLSQSVDNFSKEFGERISDTFKDIEPKFRKTAKTVMEKTAAVVDDLARALNESVKNMEEKLQNCCEEECCDEAEEDCCCDDEPKEN